MSDKTPEEVLELARQRMALNKEQARRQRVQIQQARAERDQPWRYVFLAALGILLLALILTPGAPLEQKMYAIVHGLVAQQHNVFLGGLQFPLCARNIGIYGSFLVTMTYLLGRGRSRAGRLPSRPITVTLVMFAVVMTVDGFNSMFAEMGRPYLYTPHNALRILTGIGMGVAISVAALLVFNRALRQDIDQQQRILAGWYELGSVLALNLLVPAAIYANLGFMYWPLAALAFFGIIAELFMVNVLLASLLMGYSRSVTSLAQLARPATVALLPTLGLIATLSILRFWLEGHRLLLG